MPSRHISSKSFDEILSDLGDDPAIPDPHGIRKSPLSQSSQAKEEIDTQKKAFLKLPSFPPIQQGVFFWAIGALLCAGSIGLFFTMEALKLDSQTALEELQGQINRLNKELLLTRENWELDQEELYETIDKLEVNVHSKEVSVPIPKQIKQALPYPHEAELLRWHYLGLSRTGEIEQAFFHTGKKTIILKKEGVAVGDWQLRQIDTDSVIFTHPKGKSLTLKTSKNK